MTLEQIDYFICAAQSRTFFDAAEAMHISQSSLSKQIMKLEKELELTLKDECETCHGTGAKPGTTPQTCPKCGGKGQVVYTQQSLFGMVQNVRPCPDCNGTGKIIKDKCPNCYGTGYTASKKKIAVTIPAGIDNGETIGIRG